MKATQRTATMPVAELGRELHVSRATAYRVARKLGFRLGKRLLVSRSAFEKWLESGAGLPLGGNHTQADPNG